MDKFDYVLGIIHTNYLAFVRPETGGFYKEPLVYFVNQGMCRAYCHKIIKLSGALQELAPEKEVICNVHGVRDEFLAVGDQVTANSFTKGAYYVGTMAWAKGAKELFELMKFIQKKTGRVFKVDMYGKGPQLPQIKRTAEEAGLPVSVQMY